MPLSLNPLRWFGKPLLAPPTGEIIDPDAVQIGHWHFLDCHWDLYPISTQAELEDVRKGLTEMAEDKNNGVYPDTLYPHVYSTYEEALINAAHEDLMRLNDESIFRHHVHRCGTPHIYQHLGIHFPYCHFVAHPDLLKYEFIRGGIDEIVRLHTEYHQRVSPEGYIKV